MDLIVVAGRSLSAIAIFLAPLGRRKMAVTPQHARFNMAVLNRPRDNTRGPLAGPVVSKILWLLNKAHTGFICPGCFTSGPYKK